MSRTFLIRDEIIAEYEIERIKRNIPFGYAFAGAEILLHWRTRTAPLNALYVGFRGSSSKGIIKFSIVHSWTRREIQD